MIRVRGTLLRGEVGDIFAFNGLPISVGMDGTADYSPPREISASLSFSPRIKGGLIYSSEQGTLQISLPMPKITFDAINDILGTLQVILPVLTVEMTGTVSAEGVLNFTLPKNAIKFTGQQDIQGDLEFTLPWQRINFTGFSNETGSLNVTSPMVRFTASAEASNDGALNITLPIYRVTMSGLTSIEGDINVTLPMIIFHLEQSAESSDYLTMVMNTKNKALTLFSNYNFNSLCAFGGKHFGATDTGIFDLDTGSNDDGVQIDWNIKTGYLDLEQKKKKKLVQAWTSYKTDGNIKFTVLQPDGQEYEYILEGITETETGLRVKFGKGIRTKYVALNISNIDGSSIDLDELKLHLADSSFVKVR